MAGRDDRDRDEGGGGFTGKRNKTFRELDAQRGKSKYHSRQDDPAQQKIEKSASYEKYKKAADALFSGGVLPEGLEKKFDPEGKRKEQKDAIEKLRDAPDRKSWAEGVVAYLEKYPELPDDAYFLDSLLDHPKERIADKALGKLELMQEEGKLVLNKLPRSLEQRLKSIELISMDSETQARAKALRGKLRA
jgi:hypothetical protein